MKNKKQAILFTFICYLSFILFPFKAFASQEILNNVETLVLVKPLPHYPEVAREKGWQGTVVVKALVESNGHPAQAYVEKTSGFQPLDEAALETIRKWEFHSLHSGDLAISYWVLIPIQFTLTAEPR